VQLAKHGQRGKGARGRLVGGRQVVQMKQVCRVRTGTREHLDPGSDEPLVGGILDGREDAIGRTRTILEGGRERNRRRQRICTLERGRVIERMDVDPGEKARRVGRRTPLSQRARGQSRLPACARERASERARHLRRASAGKEKKRRDNQSACRRATAALTMPPRRQVTRYAHSPILALSQDPRFPSRSITRMCVSRSGGGPSLAEGDPSATRSRIVRAPFAGRRLRLGLRSQLRRRLLDSPLECTVATA
jgi:hypothetical protein